MVFCECINGKSRMRDILFGLEALHLNRFVFFIVRQHYIDRSLDRDSV